MKNNQKRPVILVFSFFILLLSGWFLFSMIGVFKAVRTLSWPHTQGTVISAEIREMHSSKGSTKYSPVIRYSYLVGSSGYVSDRYSSTTARGSIYQARQITNQYPANSTIRVYYKPQNAEISVLKTGLQSDDYWMPIFSLFFLIIVVLGLKRQIQRKDDNVESAPDPMTSE